MIRATLPESAPRDMLWSDSVIKEDEMLDELVEG